MGLFRPGREREFVTIVGVGVVSLSTLVVITFVASTPPQRWIGLLEKIAAAGIVAAFVRLLVIAFEDTRIVKDLYESSIDELLVAIQTATSRVWILQTWLPTLGGGAQKIVDVATSGAIDVRLIVASFHPQSAVWARIASRRVDVRDAATAKENVRASVAAFREKGLERLVRFNWAHHPGWIVVADGMVYWGATPLDRDNWSTNLLFHKAPVTDKRGEFWLKQFTTLWEPEPKTGTRWTLDYETEKKLHNAHLP